MEQFVRKTMIRAEQKLNHNLYQIFISLFYSKIYLFLFSLLPMIYCENRDFRNNAIALRIYLLQKIFSRLRICLIPKFREKLKRSKVGTKNALFPYFWVRIWKEHCHIWNQHPRICLIAKFPEKMKFHKIWGQKCLI